jgi:hypothetical protein
MSQCGDALRVPPEVSVKDAPERALEMPSPHPSVVRQIRHDCVLSPHATS